MLIFQNNTILWTKKLYFQTFIFDPTETGTGTTVTKPDNVG